MDKIKNKEMKIEKKEEKVSEGLVNVILNDNDNISNFINNTYTYLKDSIKLSEKQTLLNNTTIENIKPQINPIKTEKSLISNNTNIPTYLDVNKLKIYKSIDQIISSINTNARTNQTIPKNPTQL